MKIRFGISLASLIPHSLLSAMMVARWAKEAGYQFLQGIPLRGMSGRERFPLPMYYVEKAWNPVRSFGQARRHEPGAEGMPSCLNDWIASPSPEKCAEIFDHLPGRVISHHFENASGYLVELCPELDMTPDEIAFKCRTEGYGLVLDTEHISRNYRENDEKHAGMTSSLITGDVVRILAPHIQVVHVKNTDPDLSDAVFVKYLLQSNHRDEIDFVAEFKPAMMLPGATRQHMFDFLCQMKQLVEGYSA
ncbi:MAG: hypothetical protein NTY30_00870 [Candidatus Berkelbacteria bacterium]|nr:hypothetical protein [Candidatus Berkelbacteria bacterium]